MKLNEILEKYPQTNNEWGLHTYNFGNKNLEKKSKEPEIEA